MQLQKQQREQKCQPNTQFKFVVGEEYWRNVVSVRTDKWEYEQIVRFTDGKTVEYLKSRMVKKMKIHLVSKRKV